MANEIKKINGMPVCDEEARTAAEEAKSAADDAKKTATEAQDTAEEAKEAVEAIPTYTAGDGIDISADGVISTKESTVTTETVTAEGTMAKIAPTAGTRVTVVTTISGQSATWKRGKELALRQVPVGGNLLNDDFSWGELGSTKTQDGLTAVISDKRIATVTGTNTADGWNNILRDNVPAYYDSVTGFGRTFPAGTYAKPAGYQLSYAPVGDGSGGATVNVAASGTTFTVGTPFWITNLVINAAAGKTLNVTAPLALFAGDTMPTLDDYNYKGKTYVAKFTNNITDGTFNWTTGELKDANGALIETVDVEPILALDGEQVFFTGNGTEKVTGIVQTVGEGGTTTTKHDFDCHAFGLPVLELVGDDTLMTKDNKVEFAYTYGEMTGTCKLKWQGASSVNYPKKNYKITFDNKFEAATGWGKHKKYALKADYVDFSHVRNLVGARLWGQCVATRSGVPELMENAINKGGIDGFPICITMNGEYYGVYHFTIPKDDWLYNMGVAPVADGVEGAIPATECIISAKTNAEANLFKAEADLINDFEIEYVPDEENTDWVKTSLNALITACMNSDGSDLDTIGTMLDWNSAIDYFIFVVLCRGEDMINKNYLLVTYDGTKWYFGAYDMDSTYGQYWNGEKFIYATQGSNSASFATAAEKHKVFELIWTYKKSELKTRYEALRKKALSEDNVCLEFTNAAGAIPKVLLDEDARKWPTLPGTNVNSVEQITNWYRMRCETVDVEALHDGKAVTAYNAYTLAETAKMNANSANTAATAAQTTAEEAKTAADGKLDADSPVAKGTLKVKGTAGASIIGDYTSDIQSIAWLGKQGSYQTPTRTGQLVCGTYAYSDNDDGRLFIVGNGSGSRSATNAAVVYNDGNGWFSGDVYVGSTDKHGKDAGSVRLAKATEVVSSTDTTTNATEFYLKSSTPDSTKRFKITVDDTGAITATEVV